jgi:hypothetical protein
MDSSEISKLFVKQCNNNAIDIISDFYYKYKNEINEDDIFTAFYKASYRYDLDLMIWMYLNIPNINSEEKLCLGFFKFNKYIYKYDWRNKIMFRTFYTFDIETKLESQKSILDFYYKIVINKHLHKDNKYYKYVNDAYNFKKMDKFWLEHIIKKNNRYITCKKKNKYLKDIEPNVLVCDWINKIKSEKQNDHSSFNYLKYKIRFTEWFIDKGYQPDEDDYHYTQSSNNIQSNNIQSNNIQSENIYNLL